MRDILITTFRHRLGVIACAVMLFLPDIALSGEYFVDSRNGRDSNSGTSSDTPFRTIQKAINAMRPGDTCTVSAGTYDERVTVTSSGERGDLVSILAKGTVITKGFAILADYVCISGFTIRNTLPVDDTVSGRRDGCGIYIEGSYCQVSKNRILEASCIGINMHANDYSKMPANCLVEGNTVSKAGRCGLLVAGKNHLIKNNDVSHTRQFAGDADGIRFFGEGHIFQQNYVHDIFLHEGNEQSHIDCLQTWRDAHDIVFERNVFHNPNPGHQGLMCEEKEGVVGNLTFINNIFIMEGSNGYAPALNIKRDGQGGGSGWVENIKIVNNTFVNIGGSYSNYAIVLHEIDGATVVNNIFYNFGSRNSSYVRLGATRNVAIGYNCVFRSDGVPPANGPYPNDLWMRDPQFNNLPTKDFSLNPASPARDLGLLIQDVHDDFTGSPRPQDGKYDIGAFEIMPDCCGQPGQPNFVH